MNTIIVTAPTKRYNSNKKSYNNRTGTDSNITTLQRGANINGIVLAPSFTRSFSRLFGGTAIIFQG